MIRRIQVRRLQLLSAATIGLVILALLVSATGCEILNQSFVEPDSLTVTTDQSDQLTEISVVVSNDFNFATRDVDIEVYLFSASATYDDNVLVYTATQTFEPGDTTVTVTRTQINDYISAHAVTTPTSPYYCGVELYTPRTTTRTVKVNRDTSFTL